MTGDREEPDFTARFIHRGGDAGGGREIDRGDHDDRSRSSAIRCINGPSRSSSNALAGRFHGAFQAGPKRYSSGSSANRGNK